MRFTQVFLLVISFRSIMSVSRITLGLKKPSRLNKAQSSHPTTKLNYGTFYANNSVIVRTENIHTTTEAPGQVAYKPEDEYNEDGHNLIAQQGSGIQMDCSFNLRLDVNVTWSKVGMNERLTFNNVTQFWDKRFLAIKNEEANKWTLKIRFVKQNDNGIYRCEISGVYCSIRYYNLTVKKAYAKILGPEEDKQRIVRFGDVLRISCILDNSIEKPLYIFWYKDHRVINFNLTDGATVRESSQGSELIVPKVELSDQGNYSCVPSNAIQDSLFVFVQLKEKKKITV